MKVVASHKKAFHEYEILEKLEVGIVLSGSEVKSIRAGRVNLKDSYIRMVRGEAFVFGMHISYLSTVNKAYRPDEKRDRKLLMHKKEINKFIGKISQKGLTLVPLKLYFNAKNIAKMQIGLGRGKNLHDKRQTLKERALNKEAQMAFKRDY